MGRRCETLGKVDEGMVISESWTLYGPPEAAPKLFTVLRLINHLTPLSVPYVRKVSNSALLFLPSAKRCMDAQAIMTALSVASLFSTNVCDGMGTRDLPVHNSGGGNIRDNES